VAPLFFLFFVPIWEDAAGQLLGGVVGRRRRRGQVCVWRLRGQLGFWRALWSLRALPIGLPGGPLLGVSVDGVVFVVLVHRLVLLASMR
jgi:hypothetical protein